MALEQEYGAGYLIPWGWITHAETASVEHIKLESGTSGEKFRRRNYTHTLNINGTLQFSDMWGTVRTQKDSLTEHIESMKDNPNNFGLPINAGFYPSIPVDPSNIVFEPVSLNFEDGTLIDKLNYTVQFVFTITPADGEIGEIDIPALGIDLWDGSTYSTSVQWDRARRRKTNTISIAASISCPAQMSWKKACSFYDRVESLESLVGETVIQNLSYEKNYDQQTVSYNISAENISDEGDSTAVLRMFGYDWCIYGSLQISNDESKVEVSLSTPNSKVISNSALPNVEVLTYSLNVGAPGDVGFASDTESPNLPPVTMLTMLTNARSIRPGQYLKGIESATTDNDDWVVIMDPDPTQLWEITQSSESFDPLNKTLSVNITAKRARNITIRKDLGFTGQTPFIWSGSQMSYNLNSDISSFLFSTSVTINGNIQIPNDMSVSQANTLIEEMKDLPTFDSQKYKGYKLVSKQGNFDRITQTGTYSLQFQQIDLLSFFDEYGEPRSPRSCIWDYEVFNGVSGLQFEVTYGEKTSIDESDNTVNELSIDINMKQNPDEYIEKKSNIEQTFNLLWVRFKTNRETLGDGMYRLSSASRNFNSSTLSGTMSLSFTDDGYGDGSDNNASFVDFYGIILSESKYDCKIPTMRFGNFTDGYTNGDYAQKQGLDLFRISLSGVVKKKYFDTINEPKNKIYRSSEYKNGYLYIAGFLGRIESISINPSVKQQTADVSVSILVQPTDENGDLVIPKFDLDTLNAISVIGN